MIVLLDANVLLDLFLQREPWVAASERIAQANRGGIILVCVSAVSVANIHYVTRRLADLDVACRAVDTCLRSFEVLPVSKAILSSARLYPGSDFEDNIQVACAVANSLEGIVTRDPSGYRASPIPVFSPDSFLAHLSATRIV